MDQNRRMLHIPTKFTLFIIFLFLKTVGCALYIGKFQIDKRFVENEAGAVPTFLIIGTAKGGTTDLYEQLAAEAVNAAPERPDPPLQRSPQKEVGFLGMEETDPAKLLAQVPEYVRRLGHPCADRNVSELQSCLQSPDTQRITLDATPTYIFLPTVPAQLRAMSPNSKIIVMLRDPVQRVEILFRHFIVDQGAWKDTSLDNVTESFFNYLRNKPTVVQNLRRLANLTDPSAIADGWRDLAEAGFISDREVQLFSGGLYRYALAAWRANYFQPGRVMVIDSHAYYRNRTAVMEKVIYFLYGRSMNAVEQQAAAKKSFWRKGAPALSRAGKNWMLSTLQRAKLQSFYRRHVLRDLARTLKELQSEGAWVVGFDGPGWSHYYAFNMSSAT